MNKIEERRLLSLAKSGDMDARDALIVGTMNQVKFIAKDYVNKGILWDDIVQEGRIGLIKSIDRIIKLDEFPMRVWTYAKKKVRDRIRDMFYSDANTIRQPKSFIKKQRLLKAANALGSAMIQETNYDNNDGEFTANRLDNMLVEQDNWNRLTLNAKLLEVMDDYLTLEEEDIVKLKFGFGHEYFDTPDWQKPNKPLTLDKIAAIMNSDKKTITTRLKSAMEKLQTEEVKFQLMEWHR